MINEECKRLIKARKITIYIEEAVFLATKWKIGKTEYDFIEIRRTEEIDWDTLEAAKL